VVARRPHAHVIDASGGIDATVEAVRKKVIAMQHAGWGV
jgi:hypothetical protein